MFRGYPIKTKGFSVGASRSNEGDFMRKNARIGSCEELGIPVREGGVESVGNAPGIRNGEIEGRFERRRIFVRRIRIDQIVEIPGKRFRPHFVAHIVGIFVEAEIRVHGPVQDEHEKRYRDDRFGERKSGFPRFHRISLWGRFPSRRRSVGNGGRTRSGSPDDLRLGGSDDDFGSGTEIFLDQNFVTEIFSRERMGCRNRCGDGFRSDFGNRDFRSRNEFVFRSFLEESDIFSKSLLYVFDRQGFRAVSLLPGNDERLVFSGAHPQKRLMESWRRSSSANLDDGSSETPAVETRFEYPTVRKASGIGNSNLIPFLYAISGFADSLFFRFRHDGIPLLEPS